jgi:hypothetical protein
MGILKVVNSRALRLLRGMLVTGTSVVLSSTAHIAAGGAAPGLAGLAIAMLLGSTLGLIVLAGPRLSLVRTAIVITAGQVVFHAVFGLSAPVGSAGHEHGSMPLTGDGLLAAASETAAATTSSGAAMVATHVLAGILSLILILTEQKLLDRIVAATLWVVRRVLSPVVTPVDSPCARVGVSTRFSQPLGRPSRRVVPRRGPPLTAALAH